DLVNSYDQELSGEQSIPYGGHVIRVQERQSRNHRLICICRDDWPKVEQAAGVTSASKLPDKDDDWLSTDDTTQIPGGNRLALQAAVKEILGAYDAEQSGEQSITYNGQSIRVQKMRTPIGGRQPRLSRCF